MRPGIRSRRSLAVSFVLACAFLAATAVPARADITAFLGLSPTPDNHSVKGFGVGVGLLIVGFEFEYSNLSEDTFEQLPGLKTYAGNVLVQTPDTLDPALRDSRRPGLPGELLATSKRPISAPTSVAAPRSIWLDLFACEWTIGSSSCRASPFTTSTNASTSART